MSIAKGPACAGCGYVNEADALACSLCGAVLGRRPTTPAPTAPAPAEEPAPAAVEEPVDDEDRFRPPAHHLRPAPVEAPPAVGSWATHVPLPVVHLAAGVPGALALNLLCCGLLGWGMGAPAHEFGHAIFGWLLGFPSIPLPVVTFHGQQSVVAFVLAWGAVGTLVVRSRPPLSVLAPLAALPLIFGVLALQPVREVVFLWGGHGGEVLFAALFFYLALRGGLDKPYERPIYATLAWSAWFNNVNMFRKLITDPAFQYVYHVQSFLMADGTNDYSRIAAYFDTTVPRAATVGLVTSLLIPPLGVLVWWLGHRHELWRDPVPLPAWLRRRAAP
ncbi:MAG: hypothetical protein KIT58_14365 [Planctomycetota bacterium]|nr:hypothetical protein [Planctomycetota bacterium]